MGKVSDRQSSLGSQVRRQNEALMRTLPHRPGLGRLQREVFRAIRFTGLEALDLEHTNFRGALDELFGLLLKFDGAQRFL